MRAPCSWLGLLLALPACAPEEIVLASRERPGKSIVIVTSGIPCNDPRDCRVDESCNRNGCATATGVCEPLPESCSDELAPVCGCDGLFYFNDCLRRERGVALARVEECLPLALFCGGPLDLPCPGGSHCGKRLPPNAPICPSDAPGMCWVLPVCGPDPVGVERWALCGGAGACVDTCTAIESETAHLPASCGLAP
jgi:hypothetical protein